MCSSDLSQNDFDIELDEWEVEKIVRHRQMPDGNFEFLVKWKGFSKMTWEPLLNFIHTYSSPWRDYVMENNLKFNLVDYFKEMTHPTKTPRQGEGEGQRNPRQ